MQVRTGIPVSPGFVKGEALVLGKENFRIPRKFVARSAIDHELSRLQSGIDAVCDDIERDEAVVSEQLGPEYGAIFSAHLQMARDRRFIEEVTRLIQEECASPEYAVSRVLRRFAEQMQKLGNEYLAERALDIYDLEKRLLRQLLGESREELSSLTSPVIILAHDLTPGETANLNPEFVLGFATEVGGPTSHTAILAGALEIPAVVGLGRFVSEVSGGETVLLDGDRGQVLIDPDTEALHRFDEDSARRTEVRARLDQLRDVAAETKDGTRIRIFCNIEFPEEVEQCRKRGADGVGLYRTEFLYLGREEEPTEEDHYEAYCSVIDACEGQPVTIRTMDFGADKVPMRIRDRFPSSGNPMLGLRSIRLSLQSTALFKVQLRAILRASVRGDVRVMFPLVASLLEFRQARMILMDVMEDLDELGIPYRADIPVGMMVEVPSAVMLAEEFAAEVDFFSVGTNDLIQYTLACDRADPAVVSLYRAGDPSILRMLKMVTTAAEKHGKPVTVCGQMSADVRFVPLLLGLGIRQLSAAAHSIPRVKDVIRRLTMEEAREIADDCMKLELAREVEHYLLGRLVRIAPDYAG